MKKCLVFLFLVFAFCFFRCEESHPDRCSVPDFVYLSQPDQITCGPTCAAMLLNYYEIDVTVEEVGEKCRTRCFVWNGENIGMTSPHYLAWSLDHFGIPAKVVRGRLSSLKKFISEERYPIVLVRSGDVLWHYMVAIGYNETHIAFADPANGCKIEVEVDKFLSAWRFATDIRGNSFGIKCPLCKKGCIFCYGSIDPIQEMLTIAEVYSNTMIVPDK